MLTLWGGWFPTGVSGLNRKQLRSLERKGFLKSKLIRLDSGTLIRVWSKKKDFDLEDTK